MPPKSKGNFKDFLAGGLSGCVAKTSVAPLDRVKILMQGQRIEFLNLGPLQVLKSVYIKEGIRGLYQGNLTQLIRIFPYSATQFGTFRIYREWLHSIGIYGPLRVENFIAGSLAGITSCTLTYPLDLIRSRIAFQDQTPNHYKSQMSTKTENISSKLEFDGPKVNINLGPNPTASSSSSNETKYYQRKGISGRTVVYRGIIDAFLTIYKQQGIKGLYKGFSPTLIGMAPYAGFSFYTFKLMQATLLDNNIMYVESNDKKHLSVYGNLICGSVAGLVAQTVSYPLDVVRRVMQISINKGKFHRSDGRRRTWYSVMRLIFIKYGIIQGLFRGLTINYIRVIPVVAVSFTTFEYLTKQL